MDRVIWSEALLVVFKAVVPGAPGFSDRIAMTLSATLAAQEHSGRKGILACQRKVVNG